MFILKLEINVQHHYNKHIKQLDEMLIFSKKSFSLKENLTNYISEKYQNNFYKLLNFKYYLIKFLFRFEKINNLQGSLLYQHLNMDKLNLEV